MSKFTEVTLNSETEIYFKEHEILMSFYNNEANWAFQEWWNLKGSELFNEYLKDSISWNHLVNKLEEK